MPVTEYIFPLSCGDGATNLASLVYTWLKAWSNIYLHFEWLHVYTLFATSVTFRNDSCGIYNNTEGFFFSTFKAINWVKSKTPPERKS